MFIRDIRSKNLLENLLISAIASVLIVRVFLTLTGFPQISPGGLHIAHMLWGGLFMFITIYVLLSSSHPNIKYTASIMGGIGFGLFIDEIGKFITQDNNYFYKPTYAIIYCIFVLLFFSLRFLLKKDLTPEEKRIYELDQEKLAVIHQNTNKYTFSIHDIFAKYYFLLKKQSWFIAALFIFFVIKVTISFLATVYFSVGGILTIYNNPNIDFFDFFSVSGNLISAFIAIYGVLQIRKSKKIAYSFFKQAIIFALLTEQVFTFYSSQLGAVSGLLVNLILLTIINAMIANEEKELSYR